MKFCQYCGRQVRDEDKFCEGCGARLDEYVEPAIITPNNETVVEEDDAKSKTPHWLLKMFSIICCITPWFIAPPVAVGFGIAGLVLDKKGEFKGRYMLGIIAGGIITLIYVAYYMILIANSITLY